MEMDFSVYSVSDGDLLQADKGFCFLIILRGSGSFTSGALTLELIQNDVLQLPNNYTGIIRCDKEKKINIGQILLMDQEMTPQPPRVLPGADTELIRKVFTLGLENQDVTLLHYDTINALIQQLMFAALIAGGIQARQINPIVMQVIEDINKNYTKEDYDIRVAIEKTGYTINHFRKLFQSETGLTPAEFITRRRIDRAINLFHTFGDHIPIKEVAFQCGYSDPLYFSRVFKNIRGVSPSQYLSEIINQPSK